jgi:hypothetical protein
MAAFYDNLAATFGIEKTMEIAEAAATWIQKKKDEMYLAEIFVLAEKDKRENEEKLRRQNIVSEIISAKRILSAHMDIPMIITKYFDINSSNGSGPNKEHVLNLKKAISSLSDDKGNTWTPNQVIEYMKSVMKIPHFNGGVNNDRVISLKDNLTWVLAKMFAAGEVRIS